MAIRLKPIGFRGMCKECNSLDKMPSKKCRKWKRGAKQKAKRNLDNELRDR